MLFCLWFRLWEEKGNRVGYIATQQSADWILPVPPSASSSSFPFLPFSLSFLLFHWFPFLSLCLSFFLPSLYARSALAHFSCGSFGRDSVESSRVATLVENPLQLSLSLSRLTVIWLPVQRQVRRMSSSGAGFWLRPAVSSLPIHQCKSISSLLSLFWNPFLSCLSVKDIWG